MEKRDRVLRWFHNFEREMPPWLKRAWTVYLVWILLVAMSAYSVTFLFDRVLSRPIDVHYGTIARATKTEGDFKKTYRAMEENGQIKIVVEDQQYLGGDPPPPQ